MDWTILIYLIATVHCVNGEYPYYGKKIGDNWGSNALNEIAGTVYAVDKSTIQIIDFRFEPSENNTGDVFFLGEGKSFADAKANVAAITAFTVLSTPLKKSTARKVTLSLPDGKEIKDFTYLAAATNFGGIKALYGGIAIESGFVAPAPQSIGVFSQLAHDVASGTVTVLTDRSIEIKAMRYDGSGPDAYFYVGVTDKVKLQTEPYGIIPDENGNSDRKAGAYADRDIILTLPDTMSATDLKWLSMFCVQYSHDFGNVRFPAELNVPPHMGKISIDREGLNCEPLSDNLQVAWLITGDKIEIELAGNIKRNSDYMAFGLSGSDGTFQMLQADVVVVDYKEDRAPRAVDYYLSSLAQCSDNGGVCPDTSKFNSGKNDSTVITGQITNGITRVSYSRPLITGDTDRDQEYKVDGTLQQIVWAIGPLNTKDEAAKHYANERSSKSVQIDFNRTLKDNCPAFTIVPDAPPPDFKPHYLYGTDDQTVFTVDIGQAGSEQGYKALTGNPSWGIAWYVNGILIPEIYLKRGVSYTFRVGGGTNPAEGSMYHPFYFTDDVKGGYQTNGRGKIFPGKVNGNTAETAVGGYCEYKLTYRAVAALDAGHVYQCFEEFQKDLYLDCSGSENYKDFVFTPDASTPDLIYYQCYTHESLGWKVHVVDELPSNEIQPEVCAAPPAVNTVATSLMFAMLVLLYF